MITFKNILESSKYFWINTFKDMVNIKYRTTRKKSSFQKENVKPIKMAFSVIGKDAKSVSKIDKYPIIIMHGLFGSKMNWNSLAKVFHTETNKKVYLVDARNHGDSPHVNEHTYFHLAEDINLFMSDNNIEKATLIGHSMGGRAVMLFSILYSEKVESLTVADISPVSSPNSMKQMNKLFFAVKDVKLDNKLTLSNGRNLAIAQLTESIKSKSLANFLSMNLAKTESGEFYWKVNVDAIIKIYDPHITIFPLQEGKYYGPTMFICGAESDFVNFDDIGKIKKLFPNADFVKIENAGHWLHAENPKKFSDITCKFIKSAIKS